MTEDQVGDVVFPWFREYGATFRIKGCLGVCSLLRVICNLALRLFCRRTDL